MYFSTFVLVLCCSRGCVRLLGLKKLVAIGGTLMVMRSDGLLQLVYLLLAGLLFATRAAGLLSMRGGGCASLPPDMSISSAFGACLLILLSLLVLLSLFTGACSLFGCVCLFRGACSFCSLICTCLYTLICWFPALFYF
jgi:hypothetical protein